MAVFVLMRSTASIVPVLTAQRVLRELMGPPVSTILGIPYYGRDVVSYAVNDGHVRRNAAGDRVLIQPLLLECVVA